MTVYDKMNDALEELKGLFEFTDNANLFNMVSIHYWNCYVRKEKKECLLCELLEHFNKKKSLVNEQ